MSSYPIVICENQDFQKFEQGMISKIISVYTFGFWRTCVPFAMLSSIEKNLPHHGYRTNVKNIRNRSNGYLFVRVKRLWL